MHPMNRPSTGICSIKGCPHLLWDRYLVRGDPKKPARRRICGLAGHTPSYLDRCPLESGGIA